MSGTLLPDESLALDDRRTHIPEATVARLPIYLRILLEFADREIATISSDRLAMRAGVNAAQVRKDLSYLGSYGTRGVGYDVELLIYQISRELGLTKEWSAAIVGVGNLGHALANYRGFGERGFRIAGLYDVDPRKIGEQLAGMQIRHLDSLAKDVAREGIAIGIITVPASFAQDVADRMVEAGISAILNFAPAVVVVPDHVSLRKVDLSIELQILNYYQQRKTGMVAILDGKAGVPTSEPKGERV
jgi:redox-sensing transcriptional repressor